MNDFKLAADELRAAASWKDRALKAEAKLAKFERQERIAKLSKLAESKNAALPQNVDLMKCSEEVLANVERALALISPKGEIKLGGLDEDSSVPAGRQRSELDEFLLTYQPGVPSGV